MKQHQQMASEVRQNNDQTMTKRMTKNKMTNDREQNDLTIFSDIIM
jgi:hypothetical protein